MQYSARPRLADMLDYHHDHRRDRSAQLLFVAAGHRGAAADQSRHPRALARAPGQRVLGVGYCTPYLGLFREDCERCLAFMPAKQGVMKWPTARPALSALVDEFDLPLPDASVDRILLVHALEVSDDPEGCCARCGACWRRAAA